MIFIKQSLPIDIIKPKTKPSIQYNPTLLPITYHNINITNNNSLIFSISK